MKQVLIYSLKVWLTGAVIAPILYVLIELLSHPGYFDNLKQELGFVGYSIPYGLIISIPSWILLLSTLVIFEYTSASVLTKKIALSIIGAVLAYAPFYLLFHSDGDIKWFDDFLWASSYSLIIVASIWFYNFTKVIDYYKNR